MSVVFFFVDNGQGKQPSMAFFFFLFCDSFLAPSLPFLLKRNLLHFVLYTYPFNTHASLHLPTCFPRPDGAP